MQQLPEDEQTQLIKAFANADMRLDDLWLAYFSLGGNAGRYEVEAYLTRLMPLSAHEHNVLAQAVNERLAELLPPPRAPYRDPEAPTDDEHAQGHHDDGARNGDGHRPTIDSHPPGSEPKPRSDEQSPRQLE